MVNSLLNEYKHTNYYTHEELVERSVDFESLIDKLVELTNIPQSMRSISTNKIRINQLTAQIYEIVRLNKKPLQENVKIQNLFDL